MRYIYVDDQNNILKWPVTVSDLTAQPPRLGREINTSLSRNVTDAGFPHLGIYPITEIERPTINRRTQTAEQDTSPALIDGVWVLGWTVSAKTQVEIDAFDAKVRHGIKREASHRITRLAPEWKQRNVMARGLEFARKLIHNGPDSLTPEEKTEEAAMDDLWSEIKRLRAVSDTLEAMDPPPEDYDDDRHWLVP